MYEIQHLVLEIPTLHNLIHYDVNATIQVVL